MPSFIHHSFDDDPDKGMHHGLCVEGRIQYTYIHHHQQYLLQPWGPVTGP